MIILSSITGYIAKRKRKAAALKNKKENNIEMNLARANNNCPRANNSCPRARANNSNAQIFSPPPLPSSNINSPPPLPPTFSTSNRNIPNSPQRNGPFNQVTPIPVQPNTNNRRVIEDAYVPGNNRVMHADSIPMQNVAIPKPMDKELKPYSPVVNRQQEHAKPGLHGGLSYPEA